jgi:glutamyl-tRNA reductase
MSALEQIFAGEVVGRFAASRGSLKTLADLRAHAAKIADDVVHANAGAWESASPRDLERVEAVAQAVVNRLLHTPAARMTQLGDDDRLGALTAAVRDLFGLDAALTLSAQAARVRA